MGGPQNRVYWPPGMEEMVKPLGSAWSGRDVSIRHEHGWNVSDKRNCTK